MKKIAIVIPIHNRLQLTKQGLQYLFETLTYYQNSGANSLSFSTIIVDDGSTDGSAEWIIERYPNIKLLSGDGNLWWSGAINLGSRYAIDVLDSDYILLWNDDIVPREDYFVQLEKLFNKMGTPNIILGSHIMDYDDQTKIWANGGFFNRFSGEIKMVDQKARISDGLIECDWLNGMGTLVPTSVIRKYDLWWDQQRFPQYHGDADFILKCKKIGVKAYTHVDLVLFNKTEFTGLKTKKTIRDVYQGLTSTRSLYNVHRDYLFYTAHGALPFAYFGMFKKYFFYLGGFIRNAMLARTR